MLKKWGVWLAVVVCALNLVSAAPGIPFAPKATLRVAAAATVVVSALIVVLVVVLPASRRAFVATRASEKTGCPVANQPPSVRRNWLGAKGVRKAQLVRDADGWRRPNVSPPATPQDVWRG